MDQQEPEVSRITADEAKTRVDQGEPITFIDARSPESWGKSDVKIKSAIRIPADQIAQRLNDIPRNRSVILYCT
jgi:rhodanese-related sulfurtransferase